MKETIIIIGLIAIVIGLVVWISKPQKIDATKTDTGKGYNIRIIDGCEYIEVDNGVLNDRVYSLTHKGDCKNPIHKEEKP